MLERMLDDMRLRNYSGRTMTIYRAHIETLGRHFEALPEQLDLEDVRRYLLHLINVRRCSWSWWKQAVAALRFFYGVTLGRAGVVPSLPYPRTEVHLPQVLSPAEVRLLLDAASDIRQRAMLMTLYAAGLRTSEVHGLATEHVDPERMVLFVHQGKGRKDRLVPLSGTLLQTLRQYWRERGMARWVFPGRDPDRPLGTRAILTAVQAAARRAGIAKPVTARTLRHSYATHLLEMGTDLRVIQQLLGHASLTATIVYAHVGMRTLNAVRNPLDALDMATLPRQLALDLWPTGAAR